MSAGNASPTKARVRGSLRCSTNDTRNTVVEEFEDFVSRMAGLYNAGVEVSVEKVVPVLVNDETCIRMLRHATRAVQGKDVPTYQSNGGEDFALYPISKVLARLGVATPSSTFVDLHRGDFDADQESIKVGALMASATALTALAA